MCYPKPGPRCSRHAFKDLKRAIKNYSRDQSIENRDKLLLAEQSFYATPKGIEKLQKTIADDPTNEALQMTLMDAIERRNTSIEMWNAAQSQEFSKTHRQHALNAVNRESGVLSSLQPRIDELNAELQNQQPTASSHPWGTPDSMYAGVILKEGQESSSLTIELEE